MDSSCSATSTAARTLIRLAAVKYPLMHPHRQVTGRKQANSRRAGAAAPFPTQWTAMWGAPRTRIVATAPLHRRLYSPALRSIHRTFSGFFRPSSPAHRYMADVRTPAIPAVMDSIPTLITSCSSPIPALPSREERNT